MSSKARWYSVLSLLPYLKIQSKVRESKRSFDGNCNMFHFIGASLYLYIKLLPMIGHEGGPGMAENCLTEALTAFATA